MDTYRDDMNALNIANNIRNITTNTLYDIELHNKTIQSLIDDLDEFLDE